jgi:hypothetical protein
VHLIWCWPNQLRSHLATSAHFRRPLFTYAMVEGPEGKGGIAQRREITTKALSDYGIKRVEELAKAPNVSQKPQYFKGRDAEDYVLANVVTSRHPMAMHRLGVSRVKLSRWRQFFIFRHLSRPHRNSPPADKYGVSRAWANQSTALLPNVAGRREQELISL